MWLKIRTVFSTSSNNFLENLSESLVLILPVHGCVVVHLFFQIFIQRLKRISCYIAEMVQGCLGYIYTIKSPWGVLSFQTRCSCTIVDTWAMTSTPKMLFLSARHQVSERCLSVSAVSFCDIPPRCSPFKVNQILWDPVVCLNQIREGTPTLGHQVCSASLSASLRLF